MRSKEKASETINLLYIGFAERLTNYPRRKLINLNKNEQETEGKVEKTLRKLLREAIQKWKEKFPKTTQRRKKW